jgi:hypothetical protein
MRWIGPWRHGTQTFAPCLRRLASCFLPLMALAALVMSSHALHDGFELLRW